MCWSWCPLQPQPLWIPQAQVSTSQYSVFLCCGTKHMQKHTHRCLLLGAVSQPWRLRPSFHACSPSPVRRRRSPSYERPRRSPSPVRRRRSPSYEGRRSLSPIRRDRCAFPIL